MSELAIRAAAPDPDSWVEVVSDIIKLAAHVAETDFVPKALRGNAPAVTAVMLRGRELGLGPMTSLALLDVIEGRPAIKAEGQRALVLAAGHEMEFTELSDAVVTVRGRRAGYERWTTVTWSMDRARQAGLAGKTNYRAYPRSMLAARASAELCRLVFSDVLSGVVATEELDGGAEVEQTPSAARKRTVERRTVPTALELPPPPPVAPEAPSAEEPPGWDAPPPPPPAVSAAPEAADHATAMVTPAQLRMLGALWSNFGVSDDERRAFSGVLIGRDLEGTTKNLYKEQASRLINSLGLMWAEAEEDRARARELLLREIDEISHRAAR